MQCTHPLLARRIVLIIGVTLLAALGTYALDYGRAASAMVSLEPETGSLSGQAGVGSDTAASGGRFVTFSAPASGGGVDTTPPNVIITSPKQGITFGGSYHFLATATDNVAVTKVVFTVDGKVTATVTSLSPSVPGSYKAPDWDSRTASNGTHTMAAQSFDAAGNSSALSTSTVTIKN